MRIRQLVGAPLALVILALVAAGCATAEPEAQAAPVAPEPAAPAVPAQAAQRVPLAPAAPAPAAPAQVAVSAPVPAATEVSRAVLARPTPVPTPVLEGSDVPWLDRYVGSVGYLPDWGEPEFGGILRYGASHVLIGHDPNYGHSFEGPQFLPTYNALLRFDPWIGLAGPIEGDLAETWSISPDGLAVTFKLRQGIKFQDNPNLPDEIAARVSGDEFTCEDAKASLEFAIYPPENFSEAGLFHAGPRAALGHMQSASCPDGPLGYTFLVEFSKPLARTITQFAGARGMPNNMDKDFIEWMFNECITCLDETTPETFLYGTGTGAFVPVAFPAGRADQSPAQPHILEAGLAAIGRHGPVHDCRRHHPTHRTDDRPD